MARLIGRYVHFAVRKHKLVVALAVAALIGSAALASTLTVDSSMEGMLPEDNAVVLAMRQLEDEFGNQDQVVVAVKGGDRALKETFLADLADGIGQLQVATSVLYKVELGGQTSYLASESGAVYLMSIVPDIQVADMINSRDAFFEALFQEIDRTLAQERFAGLDAGVTGGQLIQDYESDAQLTDGFGATALITLLIIIGIFVVSFKRFFLPAATALPLVLGVTATAAVAAAVFGSLNMFSVSFAVLLLGMGVDYAIHILARYGEQRRAGDSLEEALTATLTRTGAAMLVATVTTALAFASFLLAQLGAFAQMGIISAVGMCLAMTAQILVTPALIAWAERRRERGSRSSEFTFLRPLGAFAARRGVVVVLAAAALMALAWPNVAKTEIDGNVTNLYPKGMASQEWLKVVQAEFDYNPDQITLMADDLDQLADFDRRLEAMDRVGGVESILDYLPSDPAAREAAQGALPPELTSRLVGATGKYLVAVTADVDVWDTAEMKALREDLGTLTDGIGGMPVLVDELIGIVVRDAVRISLIAAAAILATLLILFRSPRYALCTMTPLAVTLWLALGVLPLLGARLTVTSVLAFPLILGIGMGGAVHVAFRVKQSGDIPATLVHTGKAVVLSSLTTLVGFGSLMFGGHPALANLGVLVTLGLGLGLALTLTLLPALLGLRGRASSPRR